MRIQMRNERNRAQAMFGEEVTRRSVDLSQSLRLISGGSAYVADEVIIPPKPEALKLQQAIEANPQAIHQRWGKMPRRNPHFTAREAVITKLGDALTQHAQLALHDNPIPESELKVQTTMGLGGVGKTQVVNEYAHRTFEEDQQKPAEERRYQMIIWLNASPNALALEFRALAEYLGLSFSHKEKTAIIVGAVYGFLTKLPRLLLIFDNAQNWESIACFLPQAVQVRQCHCLITSRSAHWGNQIEAIPVDLFTCDESRDYLYKALGKVVVLAANEKAQKPAASDDEHNVPRVDSTVAAEKKWLDKLSETLGRLPLALAQAAGYLNQHPEMAISQFLERYEIRKASLLNSEVEVKDDYERTVLTTWLVSCTEIVQKNRLALDVLLACACLDGNHVARQLLMEYVIVKNKQTAAQQASAEAEDIIPLEREAEAIQLLNHGDFMEWIGDVDAEIDSSIELDRAAALLSGYSLIDVTDKEAGESGYRFHPLLQSVLQLWMQMNLRIKELVVLDEQVQKEGLWHRTLAGTGKFLVAEAEERDTSNEDLGRRRMLIPHMATSETLLAESTLDKAYRLVLQEGIMDGLAMIYHRFGQPDEMTQLTERALAIKKEYYGCDHYRVADALTSLGVALMMSGEIQASRQKLMQALSILMAFFGEHDIKLTPVLGRLGDALIASGDYKDAKDCLITTLAVQKIFYETDNGAIAVTLSNLAKALMELGEEQAAKTHLERALAIQERLLGVDHPEVAITLGSLGSVMHLLGDLQAARTHLERALAIEKLLYGDEHYEVGATLGRLGDVLRELGNFRSAKSYLEQALNIRERHFGSEHYQVAITKIQFGQLLLGEGDCQASKILFEQALSIMRPHFGGSHSKVADTLYFLGVALNRQGEIQAAKSTLVEAATIYKENGVNPKHEAITLFELGHVLISLEDWHEAKPVFERARSIWLNLKSVHQTVSKLPAGLKYQKIPGDGHCLFNAIGLYLGKDAATLRTEVSAYMENNLEDLGNFFAGTEQDFRAHISAIRDSNEWGDNLEIEVIHRMTNRPIIIIQLGQTPIIPDVEQYQGTPIFIHYNGHNHYDGFVLREGVNGHKVLEELRRCPGEKEPVNMSATQFDDRSLNRFPVALVEVGLSIALGALGEIQEERACLERSLKTFECRYGIEHSSLLPLLTSLSIALNDLGDKLEEKRVLERILVIQKDSSKPECEVATTYRKLGDVLGELGDVKEKQAHLEHALLKFKAYYGAKHHEVAEVAEVLASLGEVQQILGNVEDAEKNLLSALLILKEQYGLMDYRVAFALGTLGDVLSDLGELQKAKMILEQALLILEQYDDLYHYQVALTLKSLANVLDELGDNQGQKELLQRALPMFEQHFGARHLQVATILASLGLALGNLREFESAKDYLKRALSIEEEHKGPENIVRLGCLRHLLATMLGELGDIQGVKKQLEHAVHIFEEQGSSCDPLLLKNLQLLARADKELGDIADWKVRLEQAFVVQERISGADAIELVPMLMNLGTAQGLQGEALIAKASLEKALVICKKHFDENSPELITLLCELAIAEANLGNLNKAINYAKHADEINTSLSVYMRHPNSEGIEQMLLSLLSRSQLSSSDDAEETYETATEEEETPDLFLASLNGQEEAVKILLARGADVNVADEDGWTALMLASLKGHKAVLEALLEGGADVTAMRRDGSTALMMACANGYKESAKALLEYGAQVNAIKNDGSTALIHASNDGCLSVVQELLAYGAEMESRTHMGDTALMLASLEGHLEIVEALLVRGADVTATRASGSAALMMATSGGHVEVMKALLKKGAVVDATETDGTTALMVALARGQQKAAKVLLEHGGLVNVTREGNITALMLACSKGYLAVVKELLAHGADIEAADEEGDTALMVASLEGHAAVVNVLLSGGADVKAQRGDGTTALMIASQNAHKAIVKALLLAGADVQATKNNGWTALMLASKNGHMKAVKELLAHGADIEVANEEGDTALMLASLAGHEAVVNVLLSGGADAKAQREDETTALMMASQNGHGAVVEALLENGAKVGEKDNDGWTALMLASSEGHFNVVHWLLEKTEAGKEPSEKSDALGNLANHCLFEENDSEKALNYYEQAMEAFPNNGAVYHSAACCAHVLGQTGKVNAYFEKGIQLSPTSGIYVEYAYFCYQEDKIQKAIDLLNASSEFPESGVQYGSEEISTLDNLLKQVVDAHESIELSGSIMRCYLLLLCYAKLNDEEKRESAFTDFQQLVEKEPSNEALCMLFQLVDSIAETMDKSCEEREGDEEAVELVQAISLSITSPTAQQLGDSLSSALQTSPRASTIEENSADSNKEESSEEPQAPSGRVARPCYQSPAP